MQTPQQNKIVPSFLPFTTWRVPVSMSWLNESVSTTLTISTINQCQLPNQYMALKHKVSSVNVSHGRNRRAHVIGIAHALSIPLVPLKTQGWFYVCVQPMRDGVTLWCKPRISPETEYDLLWIYAYVSCIVCLRWYPMYYGYLKFTFNVLCAKTDWYQWHFIQWLETRKWYERVLLFEQNTMVFVLGKPVSITEHWWGV